MAPSEKLDYGPQNRGLAGKWGKWKGVTCSADGCERPAKCRGMCDMHYRKQKWADGHRNNGDTPEAQRNSRLKYRYGITAADYDRMYAEQCGKCAICGSGRERQPAHWKDKLAVDHDHDTGKVRGLLCNDCNAGIGHLGTESVALAAAKYLRLYGRTDR